MSFSPSSRGRLTEYDLGRFPGTTLFDRVGRVVCRAECLPRKELFEAWEVARRVRRIARGGRVVDLCGGHGLLAQLMLLLDDSSPGALVVDKRVPRSAAGVHRQLVEEWPRLKGRVTFVDATIDAVPIDVGDVVVSSHACGNLTDEVLLKAASAGAAVAVLPCCHDMLRSSIRLPGAGDPDTLAGWMDRSLAVDTLRARWLAERGYHVRTQSIPAAITPKNRLLIGVRRPTTDNAPSRAARPVKDLL